ncbi:MAG: hypothetical protein L0154_16745 [Chloroflexi bacterium]|nr:hypothetical protein [Chloroflexota bacterium]
MSLRRTVVIALLLSVLLPVPVLAQDDGTASLASITSAYALTASSTSYAIVIDENTEQTMFLTRGEDELTFTSELDVSHEAQVNAGALRGQLEYEVSQSQTVGAGEPSEAAVELKFATIVDDQGVVFLNLDATAEALRPGIPSTWQPIGETATLPADTELPIEQLITFINQARLDNNVSTWLTEASVIEIEELGEDDIDDVPVVGYRVTLDLREALAAQGIDLATLLGNDVFAESGINALLGGADYSLEVWISTEDGRVREHTITLELSGALGEGDLTGELSDAMLNYDYAFEQNIELAGFDVPYVIGAYPWIGSSTTPQETAAHEWTLMCVLTSPSQAEGQGLRYR